MPATFAMLESVLAPHPTSPASPATRGRTLPGGSSNSRLPALLAVFALWLAIYFASLWTPPLLDDADATHAQAAQAMLQTGDWVTLHVDGVRYLEKPPLPYWIGALSLRVFAPHPGPLSAFAIHLPLALTVLALALLGFTWSRRAFGGPAAFCTAVFVLTSTGVFLFTRIFIPDALLALLLALSLYCLLRALEPPPEPGAPSSTRSLTARQGGVLGGPQTAYAYAMWASLALAVLAKGLVALIFFFGTAAIFLPLSGELPHWRRLRPFTGMLLLLAIAAPWHILAGVRNRGGEGGHGFFWFYFVNEHLLRYLGRRIPRDYNKLPAALYWSLHLVWLFPWSLFAPAAVLTAWRRRNGLLPKKEVSSRTNNDVSSRPEHRSFIAMPSGERGPQRAFFARWGAETRSFHRNTVLLLLIFSALVLVFFSLSTNQEYYTFPVYLPLLMLLSAALTTYNPQPETNNLLTLSFALFTTLSLAAALALGYGLWTSRHLPFQPDIGALLAHRGIGDYTLSMSHFFDLTGPSFAALRLPAVLAALAFALGPPVAWTLHARRRAFPALMTVALTSAVFLFAAQLAFARFAPMLSSQSFAARILALEQQRALAPDTQVLLFGDQSYGSSISFYLDRRVTLVDGRSSSMLFGSTFPDAPPVFLTSQQLLAGWGNGPRKLLFVPAEHRAEVDRLLPHAIVLAETSGKALLTDRPLGSRLNSSQLTAQQNPALPQ